MFGWIENPLKIFMIGNYVLIVCTGILGVVCIVLATTVYRLYKRLGRMNRQTQHGFQTLRHEAAMRLVPLEKQLYQQLPGEESIVYDSRNGIEPGDFTGNGAQAWDYVAHRFAGAVGEGSYQAESNLITIHRTNTQGRYELYLKRFLFDNKEHHHVPASKAKAKRTLRLTFEVKKESASHILRFVFKGETSKEVLDEKDYVVYNPDWQKAELFFSVAANEDALFRIDDLGVTAAPGRIEIRNLILLEKK